MQPTRHGEPEFAVASTARGSAPLPASLPGEGFVAAMIAGQLPARASSNAALRGRLVEAWAPPPSDLRLTDIEA
ncbi:MAG: hypothetical protein ABIQ30_05130 [Devosia sp.]